MPERTAMLAPAMVTTVLVAALFTQSSGSLLAEEECIAKPNSPVPQGQHWYYRFDHANNRQCWRLGPEGLPIQKNAVKNERQPETEATQLAAPPRMQERETTGIAPADDARDAVAPAITAMAPWPDAAKIPVLPLSQQPAQHPAATEWARSAGALDAAASIHASATGSEPSTASASASVNDVSPLVSNDAAEPRRLATARAVASAAPIQTIAEVDHTFALLMVVFAVLAVTGPIHHYTERRRQRENSNFHVPQWARVVALNAPKPRARLPFGTGSRTAKRHAPAAQRPLDQTEKLTQVLQQLVDRMQMERRQVASRISASGVHPRDRVSSVRQQAGAR